MVTSLVDNAALDACLLYCKAVQCDVLDRVRVRSCTVLDLVTGHTRIEPNDPVHVSFVHPGMVLIAAGWRAMVLAPWGRALAWNIWSPTHVVGLLLWGYSAAFWWLAPSGLCLQMSLPAPFHMSWLGPAPS